jgi:hypothetical protein
VVKKSKYYMRMLNLNACEEAKCGREDCVVGCSGLVVEDARRGLFAGYLDRPGSARVGALDFVKQGATDGIQSRTRSCKNTKTRQAKSRRESRPVRGKSRQNCCELGMDGQTSDG